MITQVERDGGTLAANVPRTPASSRVVRAFLAPSSPGQGRGGPARRVCTPFFRLGESARSPSLLVSLCRAGLSYVLCCVCDRRSARESPTPWLRHTLLRAAGSKTRTSSVGSEGYRRQAAVLVVAGRRLSTDQTTSKRAALLGLWQTVAADNEAVVGHTRRRDFLRVTCAHFALFSALTAICTADPQPVAPEMKARPDSNMNWSTRLDKPA